MVDLDTMNWWTLRYDLLVNRIEVINGYGCAGVLRLNYVDGKIAVCCGRHKLMSVKVYSIEELEEAIEYFTAWSDCLWFMNKKDVPLLNAV